VPKKTAQILKYDDCHRRDGQPEEGSDDNDKISVTGKHIKPSLSFFQREQRLISDLKGKG
jgi:hypothetical protein